MMERIAREKRQKLEAGQTLTLDDIRELSHAVVDALFDEFEIEDAGAGAALGLLEEIAGKLHATPPPIIH